MYQHFLSGITKKCLNAFYHACSYAKADYSRFMNVTARTALHLILDLLKTQLVFLFGAKEVIAYGHISRKRWRCETLVFQYGFTWTSGDFLCMAWKSSIKSDWQWLDAVHTIIFIFIPMEYRSELLWAENILVFMQLYGTKLQRNRNDGKSYQHQLLYNETAALCGQWICWLQR